MGAKLTSCLISLPFCPWFEDSGDRKHSSVFSLPHTLQHLCNLRRTDAVLETRRTNRKLLQVRMDLESQGVLGAALRKCALTFLCLSSLYV